MSKEINFFKTNRQTFKRNLMPAFLGLFLVVLTIIGYGFTWFSNNQTDNLIKRIEWITYDMRLRLFLDKAANHDIDRRIVIVDIDEKSLKKEGHWPWPRQKVATIAKNLVSAGALGVGFDIVFPELDSNPAKILIESLKQDQTKNKALIQQLLQLQDNFDQDKKMIKTLKGLPIVLGYIFGDNKQSSATLPQADNYIDQKLSDLLSLDSYTSYIGNNAIIQKQIKVSGFFVVKPDGDAVIRRAPMIVKYQNQLHYALSLNLFRYYVEKGKKLAPIHFSAPEKIGDQLMWPAFNVEGFNDIILDEQGLVYIPYHGDGGKNKDNQGRSYTYLSATDILHHQFDPKIIKNTVVLIGTTAEGLYDLRATPVAQVYPGVEIHANLIAGLMDSTLDKKYIFALSNDIIKGADFFLIVLTGLLCALIFPFLRPSFLVSSVFFLLIAYIGLNFFLWQHYHFIFSLALPILMIFLLGMLNMAWGFLFETRNKLIMQKTFGQYVPPQLVREMAKNPDQNFGFDGENREMTVLFADIRNFTSISEKLSATELKKLLNYFFTPMTKAIFANNGTIDKYVGDMIMAFWGAPLSNENHAQEALLGTLSMLQIVEKMQPEIKKRGWPEVRIGIGLNTGKMNVGDMGSKYRRAYTVIGDAVNLGSRLESLTKQYGVALIISEATYQKTTGMLCRPLGKVRVKGKDKAVKIFEPICQITEAAESQILEVQSLKKAFNYYYRRDWIYARALFSQLNKQYPKRFLYQLYLERIAENEMANLPKNWDGAYTHSGK